MEPTDYVEVVEKLLEELDSESNRAVAIAGAAYLEVKLIQMLKASDPNDARYDDNPVTGMCLSFDKLINDAYEKSLLSERNRKTLSRLRRVRNHFAHKMFCSFDDAEIQDICRSLHSGIRFDSGREDDPRHRFAVHVYHLFNLMWIALDHEDNLNTLSL